MIIINAWKFSDSKDVPIQFIKELSNILLKIKQTNLNEKNNNNFTQKMLKVLAPTSMSFNINIVRLNVGIQKEVINYVAKEIIAGRVKEGQKIKIDSDGNKIMI